MNEDTLRKLSAWLESEAGQKALEKIRETIKEEQEKLREAVKVDPEDFKKKCNI